jgi:HD-GYP domain-containing protein (c-di-GMP phosphodiesterase class II)
MTGFRRFAQSMIPDFLLLAKLINVKTSHMVERFWCISLRLKFAFFVVVLLNVVFISLFSSTVRVMNNHVLNEIIKHGESIGNSVAVAAEDLSSKDLSKLNKLVLKAKSLSSDVEYVSVITADGRTIAHSQIEMNNGILPVMENSVIREDPNGTTVKELLRSSDSILEISRPITFADEHRATATLAINKSILLQAQDSVRSRIFLVFGIVLVLGTITTVLLTTYMMEPINELSVGVDELKKGIAKTPLKVRHGDELGKLTLNFNEMSSTIVEQQTKLGRYAQELEDAYVSTVKVLAAAIDARDTYTHGHSGRVSRFSMLIGQAIGLSKKELEDLKIACLFHDVGKIKVPDSILHKPGKLDASEYDVIIHHVENGTSILQKASSLLKYVPAVRHHHERCDGKGYPDGLSGEAIPLFASIIAVADSFDAMTSTRPYRKAFSVEMALQELLRVAGSQLRADLVAVFVKLIQQDHDRDKPIADGGDSITTGLQMQM